MQQKWVNRDKTNITTKQHKLYTCGDITHMPDVGNIRQHLPEPVCTPEMNVSDFFFGNLWSQVDGHWWLVGLDGSRVGSFRFSRYKGVLVPGTWCLVS